MTTVTWMTKTGVEVVVTAAVTECIDRQGRRKAGTAQVEATATLDGARVWDELTEIDHPTLAAKIGNIGISAERYDAIKAAIEEAKLDPVYVAYRAKVEAAYAETAEYERETARINRVMMVGA